MTCMSDAQPNRSSSDALHIYDMLDRRGVMTWDVRPLIHDEQGNVIHARYSDRCTRPRSVPLSGPIVHWPNN